MPSWLIPSLGLPVVMTTGRLVVLTLTGVTRHPIGAVGAATGSALVLLATGSVALLRARRRRRRSLRRGSIS